MIYALLLDLMMMVFGMIEGKSDAQAINRAADIDHASGLAERIGFAVVCMAVLFGVSVYMQHNTWQLVLGMALVAYGSFNLTFRLVLNTMRSPRKEWDYVSLSNNYDTAFIMLFGTWAGRAAYITEACARIAGQVIVTLK
jgi:hypothetical protein